MGKKKQAFYQQDYASHIGATALCITSFLALAFLACGTPIGMLMPRRWTITQVGYPGVIYNRPCYTLWGLRNNCWNANYTIRVDDTQIAQCPDIRTRFEAAEAFSVTALFFLLFVFGSSWYKILGSEIKTIVMLLAFFTIGATTVPFAVITAFYYTPFCDLDFLTKQEARLGPGYALTVTSFCLQGVGIILFLFLEPEHNKPKVQKSLEEESKDKESDASSHSH